MESCALTVRQEIILADADRVLPARLAGGLVQNGWKAPRSLMRGVLGRGRNRGRARNDAHASR